jgi:DNA polymerase III epsilon subunit-like protein
MSEINTLVYFDIEATGLKSSGKPRICEISLVAVNTHEKIFISEAGIAWSITMQD